MNSKSYPTALRAKMVKKMTGPNPAGVVALSKEMGIHQTTLSRWLREAAMVRPVSSDRETDDGDDRRPGG